MREMTRVARPGGLVGLREYLTFVGRLVGLYRTTPELRALLKSSLSAPRHVTRHMGAGIYIGEVPVPARGSSDG